MDIKELEQSIREKMAADVINSLTTEVKEEVLKSAAEKAIGDIASSYKLKMLIDERLTIDAGIYLEKYLKDPAIQEKLQNKAREAVGVCIDAITKSIARDLERNMKSQYHKFIKTEEE